MNRGQQPGRVSKKQRRKANKRMLEIEKDVASYEGCCLFVIDDNGGYCNEPVSNNCHIVSESAVLDGLKDDKTKKVLELEWGVSQWRPLAFSGDLVRRVQDTTTFDPSERTTGVACTARFACKPPHGDHDDEFQPIDVAEPDFDDPVERFLSGYRLVLFLADQCRKAVSLYQKQQQEVMRSPMPGGPALWLGKKKEVKDAFETLEPTVNLLGTHWHARKTGGTFDLDIVSAQVLSFRSKLRLAGGVHYGGAMAVTVFPVQGDWYKMGVLYLTRESDPAKRVIERLAGIAIASEESDDYGVNVINELMMNGWGSVAVSPESYEGLNDQDRFTIQSLVAKHTRPV